MISYTMSQQENLGQIFPLRQLPLSPPAAAPVSYTHLDVYKRQEEIVYALDAIQSPVSLYEPVYTEGGDTLYVMDQISDKKNKEEIGLKTLL